MKKEGNYAAFIVSLVIVGILVLFYAVVCCIISLSWFYSFEEITTWKTNKTPFFQEGLQRYDRSITTSAYQFSKYLAAVLWVGLGFIIYFFVRYRGRFIYKIKQLSLFCSKEVVRSLQVIESLTKEKKYSFFFIIIISFGLRCYHYFYMPVHVDELMNYYFFVDKGFLLTSIYYPFPNNHVFFSYVYWFFSHFIDDPILAGRLPSIIFFHIMLILLFIGLSRYVKNYTVALFSVIFCAFLFPSSVYAVEARGYALLSLLTLLAAFSLLAGIEKKSKEAFVIFTIASILGAFTVPIFFIPFVSFMFYGTFQSLLQKDKMLFSNLIKSGIWTGLGVLLCYLPLFIFSGIESVTANETVLPIQAGNFYSYIFPVASAEILSYLAGTRTKGWLIFLIVGLLGLFMLPKSDQRVKNWFFLTAFILGTVFLYALLSRSFMFQRTLTYTTYFLYSSAAIVVFYWVKKIARRQIIRLIVSFALALMVLVISFFQYQHNVFEPSLLPTTFYNKLEEHFTKAVVDESSVFFGVTTEYIHVLLFYQYLTDKYHTDPKPVDEFQQADFFVIEADSPDMNSYNLNKFSICDSLPSEVNFLVPLIICR
ncbi:MAG: hypothetical protein ACLFT3_01660 [Cyclobacteriaceae bacterium]